MARCYRHALAVLLLTSLVMGTEPAIAQQSSAGAGEAASVPRFLNEESSHSVLFPTTATNRLGWTLRVRIPSSRSADTMRVEIDFASTVGPTVADLNIELHLLPLASGHSPPQSSLSVSLPLRIPEGTQRARFARHVPKSSFGNQYSVQLLEHGRAIANCKSTIGTPIADTENAMRENLAEQQTWRVLWVQSDADEATRAESTELLALRLVVMPFYVASTPQQWREQIHKSTLKTPRFQIQTTRLGNLPEHWQALQAFDAITMHGDDWREISTAQTASAAAMRDWIHAGGAMIVRDAEPATDAAQPSVSYSLPSLVSISEAQTAAEAVAVQFEEFADLRSEAFERNSSYVNFTPEQMAAWQAWFPDAVERIRGSIEKFGIPQARLPSGVRSRDELAGTIVFLGKQNGQPIEILQWAAVLDRLGWRRSRLLRSGVDPILGSQRFFQWVIPGVAQPPVYTFMGLLGVFVILVGPVAYRKTTQAGRSYLMFAIAPLLAIMTTVAMLGYSIIADGFGTRVRSRQITWVDGTSGDAWTRTRSTYFAGIRPSQGLTFPADVSVTLFPDSQGQSWESRVTERFESRGVAIAREDELRLNRDFLPSRQQRQFVIERPARRWGRIVVLPSPGSAREPAAEPNSPLEASPSSTLQTEGTARLTGPASIQVRSEAAVRLDELILCDAQQRYYFLDALEPGATARAEQISRQAAFERIGEMYKRQWPVSETTPRRQNTSLSNPNYNAEVTDLISTLLSEVDGPEKPSEGVFEYELQQRMQMRSELPSNSFLGLTDLTAEAIAIPGAEVAASIHYVMGSLP